MGDRMDNKLETRIKLLEEWLQWCLDNCDDSPEYNFGTYATEQMRALLRGEESDSPSKHGM